MLAKALEGAYVLRNYKPIFGGTVSDRDKLPNQGIEVKGLTYSLFASISGS